MSTTDALLFFAQMVQEDIMLCNTIGVRQCIRCKRYKVPDIGERELCAVCIKDDAVKESLMIGGELD